METVKLGLLIKKTKVARCGEHSYPVLSITKQDGIIMQSEKFKKRIASADTSDYKIIPRGKLVQGIHIDEGNFGIQDIVDNGIVSPAYGVWDVNDGLVIPKYLEMVLRSPKSIEFYRSKLTGTVNRRGHMSDADFLSMDIPLPDRDTQSKILKTMKQTTSVLYSRQQQLAKLDELIKARFVEMFGDPKLNPYRFPCNSLSTYITFLTSGSRGWSQYFTDSGEYFITIKNVKNCKITLQDVQYVAPPDNAEAKRTKVQKNDLLISITADLGRTGVVTEEIANHGAYINQHLTCIRLKDEQVNPLYVAYYMESDAGKEQFTAKNQSAVKAGLNFNAINSLKLMAPPLSLQNQFADFVAEVDKSKVEVQKALDQTQLLFDSLMQQYFG